MLNNSGYKFRVVHLVDKLCEFKEYLFKYRDLIEEDEREVINKIEWKLIDLIIELNNH